LERPLPSTPVTLEDTSLHTPGQTDSAAQFDLRWLLGLLSRQAKLIAATVLVVTAVVALVVFQLTPRYSASALIAVDARQQNVLDPGGPMSSQPNDLARVDSEVEIVQSPSVLLAVVREMRLFEDSEFAPRRGLLDQVAEMLTEATDPPTEAELELGTLRKLQRATAVTRRALTYLIEVRVRSAESQKAADIANALSKAYINTQIEAKVQLAVGIEEALAERLEEARTALRQAEAEINRFLEQHVYAVDPATSQQIAALQEQIDRQIVQRSRIVALFEASRENIGGAEWQTLLTELDSEGLGNLASRRAQLAQRAATAGGAELTDLRAELAVLDQQLEREVQSAIDQLQVSIDAAAENERLLREKLGEAVAGSDLPTGMTLEFYEVQQQANVSRSIYESLLSQSKSIEAQKNVQVPDSRIVSAALPPLRPSFPQKRLILGLALLGSLVMGLALAFLRENYIGGFVDEAQLEGVLGVPVISALPMLFKTGEKSQRNLLASEVVERPLSPYSDAIRRAKFAIELALPVHATLGDAHVILVTSALPNEGKTQTAISLARSLARAGSRVLLIDADLRRPCLKAALGADAPADLSDYLRADEQQKAADEIIFKDSKSDLSIVFGLHSPQDPAELLLEGNRLEGLLGAVRGRFDYIVLDSSPMLPVVDTRLLLKHVSAAVLVVRFASTPQRSALRAVNDLVRFGQERVRLLAVLNRASQRAIGYGAEYGETYGEPPSSAI
jgi:polysaccharide biosynthesis transport protein